MNRSQPAPYLPAVDGLRAVAVLSVIIYHLNASLLPGGFVGVDIFFAISGYVVSKSIAERAEIGFWQYLVGFYSRRMVRIIPALVWCLLVSTVVTILLVPASWLSSSVAKTALAAFFGLSNFALVLTNDGYFSPRVEYNPFVHTWSLAVEEQFYLIFPLIFLAWITWSGRTGWRGVLACWALPTCVATSFLMAIWLGSSRPDWAFYLLPARFWELGVGAMLYQMRAQGRWLPRTSGEARSGLVVGLVLIAAGLLWSAPEAFPFPFALLPVMGSASVILAVSRIELNTSGLHRLLSSSVAIYIGRISYSLYLWHWPIFTTFRWTVGLETWLALVGALALTAAAAMLSFHVIEDPIRRSRPIRRLSGLTKLASGIAAVVLLFLVSHQLFSFRSELSLSVTRDRAIWQPAPLTSVPRGPSAAQTFAGRKLFAVGDSHTLAYGSMFNEAMTRLGIEVHEQVVMTCNIGNLLRRLGDGPECARTLEATLEWVRSNARPGDIVYFASLRTHRLSRQWERYDDARVLAGSRSAKTEQTRLLALEEVSELISILDGLQIKVLIDAPKPVFGAPPFRCADWFNRNNPICRSGFEVEKAYMLALRAPVMRSLGELKRRFKSVTVWDPLPVLCPGEICRAFASDGKPLYYDGDHLSGYGNARLYRSFSQQLRRIWTARPES